MNDEHVVHDSRAATLEKLGRVSDALKDAKKVIDMCPGSYKVGIIGYCRIVCLDACPGVLSRRFAVPGTGTRRLRKEND